jgi:enterochelin esterase-like enzyme
LIRKGDQVISQRSADGEDWHTVEIINLNIHDTLYYGVAIASHDSNKIAKASFDNLSITKYTDSFTKEMENALIRHHVLYSKYVKDSFDILVGLPLNYKSDKPVIYPTAYHLDGGDNDDHYVIRNLMTDKLVPDVITVGIGYVKSENQRVRDYISGFDKFYLFMKNELIPFIDAQYKTDPTNRTLYGYSFGGLASMQTLYKYAKDSEDMPYNGIIAGSPSL